MSRTERSTGRLIVKFTDDTRMRQRADGTLASLAGRETAGVQQLVQAFGVQLQPAIRIPADKRIGIENRASARSGKAQPDIGGMYYVTGDDASVDAAAKVLNDLPEVEFVEFEPIITIDGDCDSCGDAACADCFTCNPALYCNDADCCAAVCDIDPFCCDENAPPIPGREPPAQWDAICVSLALSICPNAPPGSVCTSPFAETCFQSHPSPGCNVDECCATVCELDTFCCDVQWDGNCVALALQNCVSNLSNDPTPSITPAQGYLTHRSYVDQFGSLPKAVGTALQLDPCDAIPTDPFLGFDGRGWDMNGLWEFSNLIIGLGGGQENNARGKGIRVGVIEHSAFADFADPSKTHEDLRGKVIPEPDQTIIINPTSPGGSLLGHHGTACLGIIGAKDQGMKGHSIEAIGGLLPGGALAESDESGMVGIAPEAELYFFPTISVEQGGRLLSAIASALTIFEPGDVLSFSIGPAGCGTLASSGANWLMLRLAADLGVTCCISAGNDCCNLDDIAQFDGQESGVIIVGASWPGAPHCRLGFSNHCEDCEAPHVVHVNAWGEAVATLGYGDLFNGNAPNVEDGYFVRAYTAAFNGTSAACPQIAGLVANLQGFAKQVFGIPLTPDQVRGVVATGTLQCMVPFIEALPGPADGAECIGDFDFEEEPALIGIYPNAVLTGESVVSIPAYDDSLIDDIVVIRGDLVFGNKFSIMGSDNNYLVLRSEYTFAKHDPDIAGPAGDVKYLGTGQTSDIMIVAQSDQKTVSNMGLQVEQLAPEVTSFLIVEMYDWLVNEWSFVAINAPAPGTENGPGPVVPIFPIGSAQRFLEPNSKKILIRLYVFGLGSEADFSGDMESTEWLNRYDWVNLTLSNGFGGGVFDPGDGGPNGGLGTE